MLTLDDVSGVVDIEGDEAAVQAIFGALTNPSPRRRPNPSSAGSSSAATSSKPAPTPIASPTHSPTATSPTGDVNFREQVTPPIDRSEARIQRSRTPTFTPKAIGCETAAFARDVGLYLRHGYAVEELRVFDSFPLTHHIECLAVLTRYVVSRSRRLT